MDNNFNWLEEPEPKKKQQWFKNYAWHIVAVVIIVCLLLYLLFSPNPTATPATEIITIQLPNKTTKILNPAEPMIKQNVAETAYKPSLYEEVAPSPSKKEVPLISSRTSRLIQPATNVGKQPDLSNIGMMEPKNSAANVTIIPQSPAITETTAVIASPTQTAPEKTTTVAAPPIQTAPSVSPSSTLTLIPSAQSKPSQVPTPVPAEPTEKTLPATTTTAPQSDIAPATSATANLHWLLQRDASHYTIQLFASHQESIVQQYIVQHHLTGQAVYARMWQNDKNWYVVLMGDYPDRNQAVSGMAQLPVALQSQNPWARSMQSVQEGIRKRLARGD